MIQKIILASLLFNTTGCKSQEKKENITAQKKDTMEHFDRNKYKEYLNNNSSQSFKLSNGDKVQLDFYENTDIEIIKKLNSPYELRKEFFYKSGGLKLEGVKFYFFPIGITKEYDENGELVKETNHDLPYKFSIDDLREKIKREYNVDIVSDYRDSDPTLIFVNRWEGYNSDGGIYKKGVPMYQIRFPILNRGTINLEINALNGETIMEMLNGKQIKP
ncbi:MAG: hypothetical protein ABI576_00185 [Flavobacterium sp.]